MKAINYVFCVLLGLSSGEVAASLSLASQETILDVKFDPDAGKIECPVLRKGHYRQGEKIKYKKHVWTVKRSIDVKATVQLKVQHDSSSTLSCIIPADDEPTLESSQPTLESSQATTVECRPIDDTRFICRQK